MVTLLSFAVPGRSIVLSSALLALCGCMPHDVPAPPPVRAATAEAASREIEALQAEVARLTEENARLRLTPPALLAQVESAVSAQDGPKAQAVLQRLAASFPHSPELGPARMSVEALLARLQAADNERKRIAALGFRALKASPVFSQDETALRISDTSITRRWTFDAYGDGWRYLEPEKGQRLLTARVMVTSRSKDPALFGIGAYAADGASLVQVGSLRYRFARWRDFGAYLGTHADFANDFSHSARIPFSAGVALSEADLRRRPLYLVVTREGCHTRFADRLVQPPVHYVPGNCASLKKTLTVDDFRDGSLAVLKRID